ncbi:ATP-binding protein [Streptomyces zingiberis]|uniref:ATP-binding protein n=1 Tax=Streptomyces zingiberis TaxID=2053010 RepID=A0ABX1BSV5_9ACTN|nr:ATP-binding protein [Streptomyces zingiberis]NJQ00794.1 ATP-binding protein [Streptomyces zingiberis]
MTGRQSNGTDQPGGFIMDPNHGGPDRHGHDETDAHPVHHGDPVHYGDPAHYGEQGEHGDEAGHRGERDAGTGPGYGSGHGADAADGGRGDAGAGGPWYPGTPVGGPDEPGAPASPSPSAALVHRPRGAALPAPPRGRSELAGGSPAAEPVRTTELVVGTDTGTGTGTGTGTAPSGAATDASGYLLTINPLDGSEVETLPPGARPGGPPARRGAAARARIDRPAPPPAPSGAAHAAASGYAVVSTLPLLERAEERIRLRGLLARGRSVRVTGARGSGRSALLEAVAEECTDLAPDGVVRLSGRHRTASDLVRDLFSVVFATGSHRRAPAELLGLVRTIGAVVVLDDLEFGGAALDELLDATPECAFLMAAGPDTPAPSADSQVAEVQLPGLSRGACTELLTHVVERPLTEDESAWTGDLWFESEGLPLRFVQAGALLRQRDALRADPHAFDGPRPGDAHGGTEAYGAVELFTPGEPGAGPEGIGAMAGGAPSPALPTLAEAAAPAGLLASRLSESARETLRLALALGGVCPHHSHLPALTEDSHADGALGELLACGLVSRSGGRHRLAAGVAAQLEAAGYGDGAAERVHLAGRHYTWWAGHPSIAPEQAAAEAETLLAVAAALVAGEEPAHATGAVLLARTTAPVLAAALDWSAWERMLRHGQEAARLSGEVAEEAYFHHELGVLALCSGKLDRARAELEASIALRGVLADRRGALSGRRALALVEDRTDGFDPGAGGPAGPAGETPDGAAQDTATPPAGVTGVLAASGAARTAGTGETVVTGAVTAPGAGRGGAHRGRSPRALLGGARRNLAAVGAGTLLAVALGTVVTLGATSGGEEEEPPGRVTTEQSATEDGGGGGLPAEAPAREATSGPAAGVSSAAAPGTATDSPSPSASGEDPEESGGTDPSASKSGGSSSGSSGSTGGSGSSTSRPATPPSRTPTSEPSQEPSGEPSEEPSDTDPPEPTSSADTSTTASGPAPDPVTGTASAPSAGSPSGSTGSTGPSGQASRPASWVTTDGPAPGGGASGGSATPGAGGGTPVI